jgi:hypothetical protein
VNWNSTFQAPAKPMRRGEKKPAKVRVRKCVICRVEFEKRTMNHVACSMPCALESVRLKREQAERKEDQVRREALKSRSDHLKEAEQPFNAWIRLGRDAADPCISCGRFHKGQWHAGHFLSVGSHPELRFHEDNVHKQCQPCNTEKGGNHHFYRINLIAKIGLARVEWLEGPHEPAKWSIDQIKAIKAEYKARLRELKARE